MRRTRGRATALEAELRRLDNQRQAGAARRAEQHVELKRLELLAERRTERARAERLRHEQRAIDELVAMRAHRDGGCFVIARTRSGGGDRDEPAIAGLLRLFGCPR